MAKELTSRQNKVYQFILEYVQSYRMAPTIREIADSMGAVSPHAPACHLHALKKKGYIGWHPNTSRGIYIILQDGMTCPTCGSEV